MPASCAYSICFFSLGLSCAVDGARVSQETPPLDRPGHTIDRSIAPIFSRPPTYTTHLRQVLCGDAGGPQRPGQAHALGEHVRPDRRHQHLLTSVWCVGNTVWGAGCEDWVG